MSGRLDPGKEVEVGVEVGVPVVVVGVGWEVVVEVEYVGVGGGEVSRMEVNEGRWGHVQGRRGHVQVDVGYFLVVRGVRC